MGNHTSAADFETPSACKQKAHGKYPWAAVDE
jgi:hypothetical protein